MKDDIQAAHRDAKARKRQKNFTINEEENDTKDLMLEQFLGSKISYQGGWVVIIKIHVFIVNSLTCVLVGLRITKDKIF